MNRTHIARNSSREIPTYIFTIIVTFLIKKNFFLSFFSLFFSFYSLIFIFITHSNLAQKKILFLKQTSHVFCKLFVFFFLISYF